MSSPLEKSVDVIHDLHRQVLENGRTIFSLQVMKDAQIAEAHAEAARTGSELADALVVVEDLKRQIASFESAIEASGKLAVDAMTLADKRGGELDAWHECADTLADLVRSLVNSEREAGVLLRASIALVEHDRLSEGLPLRSTLKIAEVEATDTIREAPAEFDWSTIALVDDEVIDAASDAWDDLVRPIPEGC